MGPTSPSKVARQFANRPMFLDPGAINPEQVRRIEAIADAAERLAALNPMFGGKPELHERTLEFATTQRQEQLDQFGEHYFGDLPYDLVYSPSLGENKTGNFVDPGDAFEGKRYPRGAIVITE